MRKDPYRSAYDGTSWFKLYHDAVEPMRRWFHNYRCDKDAWFPTVREMIIINDDKITTVRGKTLIRYRGVISNEWDKNPRKVDFELGAPPPPFTFMPVKEREADRIAERSMTGRNRQYMGPEHGSFSEWKFRQDAYMARMVPIFADYTDISMRTLQHMLMNRVIVGIDPGGKDSTAYGIMTPAKPPEPKWRRNQ